MSAAFIASSPSPPPLPAIHAYAANPFPNGHATYPHHDLPAEQFLMDSHQFRKLSVNSESYMPILDNTAPYHHTKSPPDWENPIAGPSTYRRPSRGVVSPVSGGHRSHDQSPAGKMGGSPIPPNDEPVRRGSHALRDQLLIDGTESQIRELVMDAERDDRIGVEDPIGERSYSELKCLGDGSFGTVWLVDWHSRMKSDTLLSAMQCGAGARADWVGKRLVALKRMKRVWEGGWQQAKNLGEIVSLRRIPQHPNIIPLYDAFIGSKTRELYFVFECMEGNLYQLTKSRRGRPLAAGLIASCFHQISAGLFHIHRHGYFHRDMKPENLLVTTTGLADYLATSALNALNAARAAGTEPPRTPNGDYTKYEKDVSVIVKLADFGLARETASKPPYTEYVSTRWYRAPEVLLRSVEYGPPVDMWALGTILAEMLNLKPLFPGVSEIDQVYRICDTLGDPSSEYGIDTRGRTNGGGPWNSGIKLAKNRKPVQFRGLFNEHVPESLIDCIADLLRYNPKYRMTSAQCMDHPYFHETLPHLQRTPPLPLIPFTQGQPATAPRMAPVEMNVPPRQVPPSHSHQNDQPQPAFAHGDMRTLPPPVGTPEHMVNGRAYYPQQIALPSTDPHQYGSSTLVNQLRELDLPTEDLASYGHRPPPSPTDQRIQRWLQDPRFSNQAPSEFGGSSVQPGMYNGVAYMGSQQALSNASFGNYSPASDQPYHAHHMPVSASVAAFVQQQQGQIYSPDDATRLLDPTQVQMPDPVRKASLPMAGKKKKWGLSSVFGGDKSSADLAAVPGTGYQGSTSASLKRTQSGNHPSTRSADPSPISPLAATPAAVDDPKKAKKEAQVALRAQREAEAMKQRERARAVMQKRSQLVEAQRLTNSKTEIEYATGSFGVANAASNGTNIQQPVLSQALRQHATLSRAHLPSPAPPLQHYPVVPASQSVNSVRSHESTHSKYSRQSNGSRSHDQLSAAALAASHGDIGRHKARRRDDDDDHSMSSFGQHSLQSRSALTVGTIDSDPGPRRVKSDWYDPLLPRSVSGQPPPKRDLSVGSRLASISNSSLESQLANDFMAHATMASNVSSTGSLGRFGASGLNMHDVPPVPPLPAMHQAQASAPTSPYGHPKGFAVAHGAGMGRSGTALPSLGTWHESNGTPMMDGHAPQIDQQINPMFRVPQPVQQSGLPPFSQLASLAGAQQLPDQPR